MDTTEIAVLIYFGLSLKIALTVVALTIVYKMRLQSAKGARKLKREGGQRKKSAREEKTESRPVPKSSSGRDIHKGTISSGEKPLKPGPAVNKVPAQTQKTGKAAPSDLKPGPAANKVPPQAQKIGKAAPSDLKPGPAANKVPPQAQKIGKSAPSEGIGPSSSSKKINPITFSPRNKAGEQIEPTEVRKQVQPENTAPVKSAEPRAALKDDSVSHTTLPGAPRGQSAITEPKSGEKPPKEPKAGEQIEITEAPKQDQLKNTAPVKSSEPKVTATSYTVTIPAVPSTPRGQPARTEPKRVEKPPKEPSSGSTSGGERKDVSSTVESGTEANQASSEPPEETTDSGESDQETPQTGKSGLGDLADLFATSASEFTEKSKLAEQVNDVDVNEILQEGLGLLGKVKKKSDG